MRGIGVEVGFEDEFVADVDGVLHVGFLVGFSGRMVVFPVETLPHCTTICDVLRSELTANWGLIIPLTCGRMGAQRSIISSSQPRR